MRKLPPMGVDVESLSSFLPFCVLCLHVLFLSPLPIASVDVLIAGGAKFVAVCAMHEF